LKNCLEIEMSRNIGSSVSASCDIKIRKLKIQQETIDENSNTISVSGFPLLHLYIYMESC
jgi:hypothetical protein